MANTGIHHSDRRYLHFREDGSGMVGIGFGGQGGSFDRMSEKAANASFRNHRTIDLSTPEIQF